MSTTVALGNTSYVSWWIRHFDFICLCFFMNAAGRLLACAAEANCGISTEGAAVGDKFLL